MRTHEEYQEALDELKCLEIYDDDCDGNICYESHSKIEDLYSFDILQELIDESTPKKVMNKRGSGAYVNVLVGECPKCGKFVTSIDKKPYQCDCRQELDWSDE